MLSPLLKRPGMSVNSLVIKHSGTMATHVESWCQAAFGNLLHAERPCREVPEQDVVEEQLADILLTKTEYQEARLLLFKILDYRSSCRPPISDTVMCHINLAIIAVEMGADVGVISSQPTYGYARIYK
jgi:hypothetical protein